MRLRAGALGPGTYHRPEAEAAVRKRAPATSFGARPATTPRTAARRDIADTPAASSLDASAAWESAKGKRVKGAVAFNKAPPRKTIIEEAAEAAEAVAEEASAAAAAAAAAAALAGVGEEATDAEKVAEAVAAVGSSIHLTVESLNSSVSSLSRTAKCCLNPMHEPHAYTSIQTYTSSQ